MLWTTLYNRIGRQPVKVTGHRHVYAVLENPKTHRKEQVFLDLRFDSSGNPVLVAADHNPVKKGEKRYVHK